MLNKARKEDTMKKMIFTAALVLVHQLQQWLRRATSR